MFLLGTANTIGERVGITDMPGNFVTSYCTPSQLIAAVSDQISVCRECDQMTGLEMTFHSKIAMIEKGNLKTRWILGTVNRLQKLDWCHGSS